MSAPLVSVIIGTYNRAGRIRETLASVYAQTYPHLEIVVVDDASTDDTVRVLQGEGDRIRLLRRAANSGSADIPRWEAMEACRGAYAALLDSDDRWHPEKIARQVAFMEARPELGFSHHYVRKTDPEGRDLGIRHEDRLPPTGRIARELLEHCFVSTSSVMVRPAIWLAAQRRDDLGGFGTEWDFFLSIARTYPVGLLDEVQGDYRVDPASVSHRNWKRGPWDLLAMERLRRKGLHQGLLADRAYRRLLADKAMDNALHHRGEGQGRRALWFALRGLRHAPANPGLWTEALKDLIRCL